MRSLARALWHALSGTRSLNLSRSRGYGWLCFHGAGSLIPKGGGFSLALASDKGVFPSQRSGFVALLSLATEAVDRTTLAAEGCESREGLSAPSRGTVEHGDAP